MAAATVSASSATVRYAPEDPSLPKPWIGLVDCELGYHYFWNPETNVTQFERPLVSSSTNPAPSNNALGSSFQNVRKSHDDGRYSNDGSAKFTLDPSSTVRYGPEDPSLPKPTLDPSSTVRYAPKDPSLPKQWRGLVDCELGYHYFWNLETNVTQFERPLASSSTNPAPSNNALGSSFQNVRESHDGGRYSNDGSAKFTPDPGADQSARNRSDCTLSGPDVMKNAVHIPIESKGSETGLSVEEYCRRHEISVTGGNVPRPFTSFQATGFPSEILRVVQQACFSAPTPIQAQSWPVALQGRDMVAIAKTGSGKILGYLIPGLIHLKHKRNNPELGPSILVLSPTIELATQIQDEVVKFGRSSRISCTCLYGGAPKGPQIRDLERGVDVVVATPGRLNDLLEMKKASLRQISYLVLDEVDRMLDIGFEPQIRKIVKEVPSRRQTLMYTATWPKEVRRIAADLLVNPVQVNIGNSNELVANKSIIQHIESPMDRLCRLKQILKSQEPGSKIIIFCSTKKMCDIIAENLNRQFGGAAILGDISQCERDHVLSQFRTGRSPVLVATDVAARGLDIKDSRVVINYDFPTRIEDYAHRFGSTGRTGATGEAHTFFSDKDARHASNLVKILEGANQNVPAELREMASCSGGMGQRSQWGSAPSGRDVGFGGSYGSSYCRSGGGSGCFRSGEDSEQQDRGGFGSSGRDSNASVNFHQKSFHESMMAAGATKNRERSRSRSPNRGSEWTDNNSKHSSQETAMEVARPSPSLDNQSSPNRNPDTLDCRSNNGPQNHSQKSPISSDLMFRVMLR